MAASRQLRASLGFAHDMTVVAVAWCVSFWLRFNLEIPAPFVEIMWKLLPHVMAIHAVAFWGFGLYRGLWRYASLPDLQRIVAAVGVSALAVPTVFALLRVDFNVPRSAYIITPLLTVLLMGGSRFAYRVWREHRLLAIVRHPQSNPVIVLGAGEAAVGLLRDLASSAAWRVVGVLDDDRRRHGAEIFGVKVMGAIDRVAETAERLGVTQVVLAMPGASHGARKRATDLCAAAGLQVMTVPALADIVAGRVSVSALRNVELDDLLGRDPVDLDLDGLRAFIGTRTVLVTGAGGSIGSELCRQIARFSPDRIVLFDWSEFALYSIGQEFADRFPAQRIIAVVGDAKDESRVREIFEAYAPQVVFHAAAYKHVPLMEEENAWQAVRNNVYGTLVVARAAAHAGCEKFVLISTDKAVNPTNVMGASKRLAEQVCQSVQHADGTQYVTVRFGNVLGSTGSVVPRFREQIARGGPVTVTHPDIRRYFMSIPEAAQLVLQAALMGQGGDIYVLDMGEPVRIVDLAREMIRLSGLGEQDIRIEFTGLRPGEKLYEELLADAETTQPTPHPKLRIARPGSLPDRAMAGRIAEWLEPRDRQSGADVRAALGQWVPEYRSADHSAQQT